MLGFHYQWNYLMYNAESANFAWNFLYRFAFPTWLGKLPYRASGFTNELVWKVSWLVDGKKKREMRWEMNKVQDSVIEKLTVVNDAQIVRIAPTLNRNKTKG